LIRRLVVSYLCLALVVLAVLEIPLGILTYKHEKDLLSDQASQEATSIAVVVADELTANRFTDLQQLVHRYHLEAGGEVLITTASGLSAADSDNDGPQDVRELRDPIAKMLAGQTVTGDIHDEHQLVSMAGVPVRPTTNASGRPIGAVILYLPTAATYARIHDVWLALVGFAVAVLALTGLLGVRVARSVTRPLASLERAVGELGDRRLSERAIPEGPEEIQTLARAFNAMAVRIEDLVDVQSRFVADASHQLRSPLTALRLRLENMEPDVTGPAATSLAAANREVQRLSRLIDGLLTLSRADGDRPECHPVNVAGIVEERVDAWSPLAAERGVDLRVGASRLRNPTVAFVPGDLDQILDNLLANALDATPPGRAITVEHTETRGSVDVTVVDEGPGMSEAARAHAFDRFWQGPGQQGGSSGLGLAIVRQLAQRNAATVTLSPNPPSRTDAAEPSPGLRAGIHLPR
jgi:signal transduction histidine kinase